MWRSLQVSPKSWGLREAASGCAQAPPENDPKQREKSKSRKVARKTKNEKSKRPQKSKSPEKSKSYRKKRSVEKSKSPEMSKSYRKKRSVEKSKSPEMSKSPEKPKSYRKNEKSKNPEKSKSENLLTFRFCFNLLRLAISRPVVSLADRDLDDQNKKALKAYTRPDYRRGNKNCY